MACSSCFLHCHHLVAVEGTSLGFPEVTLPVVPGMEGCHWPLRKAQREDWPQLAAMLLEGRPVRAEASVGWLVDVAAPLDEALAAAWALARGEGTAPKRTVVAAPLALEPTLAAPGETGDPSRDAARRAIWETMTAAAAVPLAEALEVQSRRSAAFMVSKPCRQGVVGAAAVRTLKV